MKKRALSIILALCLVMSMLFSIPVFATGGITVDKTQFTAGEVGKATVSGLTDEEIEYGAWLGISPVGEREENTPYYMAVSDLPANNVWEFEAPYNLGNYEARLLDGDGNLIDSVSFSVGAPKAKPGDITISKAEVKLNEPMSVTVNGLTDEMLDNDAWLGIVAANEKVENTGLEKYLLDLPSNNTYEFKAPYNFGKYEIRVFSDGVTEDKESVLFGVVSFDVVSSKAKPGDIVLSKSSVQPSEMMSVTVNGLTQGEIDQDAFIGIELVNEKIENTTVQAYVVDFKIGNVFEFQAPANPGNYEVRVICSGTIDASLYSYALFGVAPFTVSGAPSTEIAAGTEGLATWAAGEVNQANNESLTTDKVMVNFPEDITREEFCELAVLLYEKMTATKATPIAVNPFSDTTNPEILKANNLKIVGGVGDGKFAPKNKVTRQEISAMLLRTVQATLPTLDSKAEFKTTFMDLSEIAPWALDAVKFMNANDIVKGSTLSNGTSYIRPKGNTTKQEAILMVLRIFNAFDKL